MKQTPEKTEVDELLEVEHRLCPACAKHLRTKGTYSVKPNKKGVVKSIKYELPNLSGITALNSDEICTHCVGPRAEIIATIDTIVWRSENEI